MSKKYKRDEVKHRMASKAWYTRNRERILQKSRNRSITVKYDKYGITKDEYDNLWVSQEGKCAICHKEEASRSPLGRTIMLAVDHDHKTGKVRGLLCKSCNVGVGKFFDRIDILKFAISYLGIHNTLQPD